MGQVQREAKLHAGIAAGKLRYAAGLAATVAGETTLHNPGKISMVLRQPYGVTAGIIPWNVPLIM
jgi:acyl-CoA reductase-like NAD-dependent aldehyde dehydrogenase